MNDPLPSFSPYNYENIRLVGPYMAARLRFVTV